MSKTRTYTVEATEPTQGKTLSTAITPPSRVKTGERFSFSGRLFDPEDNPVGGATIYLIINDVKVGETTTASNGFAGFVVSLERAGTFSIRLRYPGTAKFRPAGSSAFSVEAT